MIARVVVTFEKILRQLKRQARQSIGHRACTFYGRWAGKHKPEGITAPYTILLAIDRKTKF